EGDRDGMRIGERPDSLDGLDVLALRIDGEDRATVDDLAAHDDGAGSTSAAVADALGAGEVKAVAEGVAERDAGFDRQVLIFAIDLECDRHRAGAYARGRVCWRGQRASRQNTGSESAATDTQAAQESAAGEVGFLVGAGFLGNVRVFL